jgi:hypothetical protein
MLIDPHQHVANASMITTSVCLFLNLFVFSVSYSAWLQLDLECLSYKV